MIQRYWLFTRLIWFNNDVRELFNATAASIPPAIRTMIYCTLMNNDVVFCITIIVLVLRNTFKSV